MPTKCKLNPTVNHNFQPTTQKQHFDALPPFTNNLKLKSLPQSISICKSARPTPQPINPVPRLEGLPSGRDWEGKQNPSPHPRGPVPPPRDQSRLVPCHHHFSHEPTASRRPHTGWDAGVVSVWLDPMGWVGLAHAHTPDVELAWRGFVAGCGRRSEVFRGLFSSLARAGTQPAR